MRLVSKVSIHMCVCVCHFRGLLRKKNDFVFIVVDLHFASKSFMDHTLSFIY